jgi:type 1 glutamine amidotransferase
MTVLPASAQPYKHFSGAAIALALALWGLCQQSAEQVRQTVSDWVCTGAGARGWQSLVRWAQQVGQGQLFAGLHATAADSARQQAERAAQALCGHAPVEFRHQGLDAQAFAGANHVS